MRSQTKQSPRMEKFLSYKSDPWFSRVWARMKESDIAVCSEFITANDHLGKNEFAEKAIRMFIDSRRPKNWTMIEELLIGANSVL